MTTSHSRRPPDRYVTAIACQNTKLYVDRDGVTSADVASPYAELLDEDILDTLDSEAANSDRSSSSRVQIRHFWWPYGDAIRT